MFPKKKRNTDDGLAITNELARVVGLIAAQHPDSAVEIRWIEGSALSIWILTATNGTDDVVYIADDESGTWMPANAEERAAVDNGQPLNF